MSALMSFNYLRNALKNYHENSVKVHYHKQTVFFPQCTTSVKAVSTAGTDTLLRDYWIPPLHWEI